MAVAKNNILIAPSTDKRTLEQLDSVGIESGFYYVKEFRTINSVTANIWTVICISSEVKNSLHCFTQIWIPGTTGSDNLTSNRVFVRTSAEDSSSYTPFTTVL